MKLKRRRTVEVPLKIKSFINNVTSTPLENIEGALRGFSWDFDKGDFHHWVDLFNHFNTFFDKYIKPRKDLQLDDDFLEYDDPFPKDAVLQVLRVMRIILENCTNKHFHSSYEHHLSSLLASTDADVVEACLQTLAAFLKKSIGKFIIRDASLNSRLFSFAQGWGGKEEGLGLVSCSVENVTDPIAFELGRTLHFEFYSLDESLDDPNITQPATNGLKVIHMPDVSARKESDLELLNELVHDYKVPQKLRFSLFTRLRFARAFSSLASRKQYTCIRLYAFVVLVQACGDADELVSFFNTEPEFINELVTLLSYEDAVSEKIRILSLLSLVALCQDRSRQSTVLTAVTSGGHRGILSSLMQKAIDSVVNNSSKWSVVFAEALLSLVTVLVSSSSGCAALREAGFIPTLLPLLKDTNTQHLHLVSTAVHVLEAFMDYSNPAAALFRDSGGLDGTISRLMMEVSFVEAGSKHQITSTDLDTPQSSGSPVIGNNIVELDNLQPLYSEALVSYHRRLLMKALLRAISLGTYAPGTTSRMCESEQSLLPHCLCMIFKRAKDFGGGVFSLAATVMSDLIHKDPTCYSILETTGLPSAFLDAIMDGVLCSSEAITCIPQCLDALCLNNNGLTAVKESNALRCFVKVFTSKAYLRVLTGDTPGSLSSGLDELMRHASSLRGTGVDMLIEILDTIAKIGSGLGSMTADSLSLSQPVSMETESSGEKDIVLLDDSDSTKAENLEQPNELPDSGIMNVDSFLPDSISNTARLLETILQNSDTCRIFVEKKGIECVLRLLTLPSVPPSVSLGQSLSTAFKNFSPQHSNSLARAVCSFLKEHLKSMDEVVTSITGSHLVQMEFSKRVDVLRSFSSLESILALCNSLLKGSTMIFSELGSADLDVLKDLGKVYKEILWQLSLSIGLEVEEKQNVEVGAESSEGGQSNVAGRDSDDDANVPSIRYMNPLSVRNSFPSPWGNERDFISVVRSGEGFSRRSRHNLARLHGIRVGRFIEAFRIDSDAGAGNAESSSRETKKKTPEMLVIDILNKLASTTRSFFTALVKSLTSPNRRRTESGSLASASKNIGAALAKIFVEALGFAGHSSSNGLDVSLSVKCQYLGKIVDDMAALTYDSRRRTCHAFMINNFYVNGTFKELLTTFEATCQLLWTPPYAVSSSATDIESSGEAHKLSQSSWLLDTLQSHCRALEYFVNSGLLLSSTSASQAQLLVQPVAVGLSIGLFPIPRDPEVFVRMLQTQVLDVVLPVWNHPMFPNCDPGFITSIISLMTHVYNGVSDMKQQGNGTSSTANQRFVPPPDEATVATIVEMGFSRARAEEALRRVEANSVELAMEWLFSHAEDPVQEEDELARALALSLGSSSETHKVDGADRSTHGVLPEEGHTAEPSADGILAAAMKLCHNSDSIAFSLTDLLLTLCSRNKGTDRSKVISYLVQQLKRCTPDYANDTSEMSVILHTLALILSEDASTREIAAQNELVSIAIDILLDFMAVTDSSVEFLVPRCISALLLILDSLVQSGPKVFDDAKVPTTRPSSGSVTHQISSEEVGTEPATDATDKDDTTKDDSFFETVLGKPTGYLTMEESHSVLAISYDLMKRHVPPMVMQAVFQLSARLTKSHALAVQFLENGGLVALFGIPRESFFPGYDTLASTIVRHLLEDPQTLQTAMESEIRQTLSGNRHNGRLSVRAFLTSLAPVITRDPVVFMRAVTAVCQFESSGGRSIIVLAKDKDKEKSKVSGAETGAASGETVRISEGKAHDGSYKSTKGHKKVSTNLTQVIDHLIEIVSAYPSSTGEDDSAGHQNAMDVDEPTAKSKGKSKVGETAITESDVVSDKSALLAKVSFVLKLLSDIITMYAHAAGVILRRDMEMCQSRGLDYSECPVKGGIIGHVLHRLLPLSVDNSAGADEWKNKLSEKASSFLVVLAGRSSEGRRRVVTELVKALSAFVKVESNSSKRNLVPDKKALAFVDLLYSILSKISSSANLPGSGCSPDVAKTMIEGGVINCLSGILQAIDLDHPDAPKVVNPILKSLESLTRAANYDEQVVKADALTKKKINGLSESSDARLVDTHSQELEYSENRGHQERASVNADSEMQGQDQNMDNIQSTEQEMVIEEAPSTDIPVDLGVDYMHEDIDEGGALSHTEQFEMSFHVQDRVDDDMNDEEDDMGDDGEDDEDEDDAEDEDEDNAEDGVGLMSLADTDVEDHDETGLGDEYNDDMVDEDDDDFHDNRVIEVRWREALDGLDHLEVFGQSGTGGLINISAEPFEGVNVDDFFGIRRSFGFERRRQANRTSHEHSVAEGNEFLHPLLARPSHSGDFVSILSGGGNSSRGSEGLSAGSLDLASFYMFDTPVLHYENNPPANLFGDRLGGSALSIGLDSVRVSGRRGPGDGRWTDNGQPQAAGQATAIAQAVEEHFISQLGNNHPTENVPEILPQNPGSEEEREGDPPMATDDQLALGGSGNDDGNVNNSDDGNPNAQPGGIGTSLEVNNVSENRNTSISEGTPSEIDGDSMDIGEENASGGETLETSSDLPIHVDHRHSSVPGSVDVEMNAAEELDAGRESNPNNGAPNSDGIDPAFLEALPEDLRAEVIASQQAQSASAPAPSTNTPSTVDEIDPEFLAALPPDIQAEVIAQQRAQRIMQRSEGQPVDMDNASIIATLPADIREEVLLTSSEALLSALPFSLLAEAQMLRDRAMSHYQARSLFGRLGSRGNRSGFDRHPMLDRGVGLTIGRTTASIGNSLKLKELEGEPLLDANGLKALIRLLRLAQPLGKGLLKRLLLNLCSHGYTRETLVRLLLDVIKPEKIGVNGGLTSMNSLRLYGCQSDVVYSQSQVCNGVPPLVLRRALEILTYIATNHAGVSSLLFHFEGPSTPTSTDVNHSGVQDYKGKGKVTEDEHHYSFSGTPGDGNVPLILLLKLLSQPLFLRSISHLEQVMSLIQVIVYAAASKVENQSSVGNTAAPENPSDNNAASDAQKESHVQEGEQRGPGQSSSSLNSHSDREGGLKVYDIFLKIPQSDLHDLCNLLGREGLSDKIYTMAGEVLTKLASVAAPHSKFFISKLSESAQELSSLACNELAALRETHMIGLNAGSMAGSAVLRVLQILSSLTSVGCNDSGDRLDNEEPEEHATMRKLNVALEPLWNELSECISTMELGLGQGSQSSVSNNNIGEHVQGSLSSPPLPPGTQRLLPFIEGFFVLCEKLQANNQLLQQDQISATAREVKESTGSSFVSSSKCADSYIRADASSTFLRFAEKHRRLLNAFVRQNPSLLEKSLSLMLKAPRLIDFDNKRAYFRSRIRQQNDQQLPGSLRINVRRAYILEDSYNQLRMRSSQDLRGRLNVHFQGEEGIDAGGLTREWYQLLSRVIFDKGALLFTTVGNNVTFQPNPNSVYQTEHLSYFKFIGRMVAKALYDGQLLDVYFTRSFYKHILGVKVTYHDIEAVDPDYYKNLKWMLENDVSDIPDLTFSMDADEEKHILYEKTEVTDYELKPGGRNIRVTEETKHEYVDLVADHILTNAIRPQINAFLEGFNELVPRELISIFNDRELELFISGLPEIDLDDLKANTEYTGYTVASSAIQWFWEVAKGFSKEDRARLLQFVTGTSKVPLEGFKALQGISGPQRFQIHKAYGAPERLPSAHTCFNQLDLPEYSSKEQLQERLLLAIHEGSEGFGFG